MKRVVMIVCFCALLFAGCSQKQDVVKVAHPDDGMATHNPTAQEMLQDNPDADFFQWGGVIYANADTIGWVRELTLTAEEKIGTIAKVYAGDGKFEDGMATKLPAGTGIYKPDTHGSSILIVKSNGNEARYLVLLEG